MAAAAAGRTWASCCPGLADGGRERLLASPLTSSNGSGKPQLKLLEKGRDSTDDKDDEGDNDRNSGSLTA